MPHILKNSNLEIHFDFPEEGYAGSRFDWSGKITRVIFEGCPITTVERTDYEDGTHLGKGLYNEFGIDSALGFEDAEIGGWFHKIGVGLLKKEDQEYLFHKAYQTQPARFKVSTTPFDITIRCTSEMVNGFAYVLNKKITIGESGWVIDYTLHNVGQKAIHTDEYVHNFMAVNNESMGCGYVLEFPFPLQPERFGETLNTEQQVIMGSNEIGFGGTPNDQFFFSNLSGGEDVNATWELHQHEHKIGICERGGFKTNKINLWGWKHVVSPELFYPIAIQPGKTTKWSRNYTVFRID
ncbi:hypothetical protein HZY62_12440 [Maribacter polysiphoniae]|uniref:Galactose mutarotase-like enzyme n=1 Tax=Maribacter polysiphoniae TaxID=429344 RepID=A0A316DWK2_9FLAO|nr:hypothetical protein [Maribacter polysiphoniae]MBD1261404.1 hypothetical protein [Maribacter polysiphoniae]PWK22737.1 hypothetical protein LX92_02674 [Maribacter polysiphoniae]